MHPSPAKLPGRFSAIGITSSIIWRASRSTRFLRLIEKPIQQRSMLYGIDQPGCDITRAFLEVLYHAPTIGSPPHESGADGSNADLDKSDAGVGIIELRSRSHDDDGLAGFDGRKRFPDRCDDRPPRDRPSRRRVIREMDRCPGAQMMIVGQCRYGLKCELLRIDPVSV